MGYCTRCGKEIIDLSGVILSGDYSWICADCIKELPVFFQELLYQNSRNTNKEIALTFEDLNDCYRWEGKQAIYKRRFIESHQYGKLHIDLKNGLFYEAQGSGFYNDINLATIFSFHEIDDVKIECIHEEKEIGSSGVYEGNYTIPGTIVFSFQPDCALLPVRRIHCKEVKVSLTVVREEKTDFFDDYDAWSNTYYKDEKTTKYYDWEYHYPTELYEIRQTILNNCKGKNSVTRFVAIWSLRSYKEQEILFDLFSHLYYPLSIIDSGSSLIKLKEDRLKSCQQPVDIDSHWFIWGVIGFVAAFILQFIEVAGNPIYAWSAAFFSHFDQNKIMDQYSWPIAAILTLLLLSTVPLLCAIIFATMEYLLLKLVINKLATIIKQSVYSPIVTKKIEKRIKKETQRRDKLCYDIEYALKFLPKQLRSSEVCSEITRMHRINPKQRIAQLYEKLELAGHLEDSAMCTILESIDEDLTASVNDVISALSKMDTNYQRRLSARQ